MSINQQTQRVMIIDDNDIDNFITQRILNKAEFTKQVDICNSGIEALNFLKTYAEEPDKLPDVIFLDLNMPVVDGFVFLFEFEDLPEVVREKCKVVILSGLLDKDVIDKVLKNQFVHDFIPKPLTAAALSRLSLNGNNVLRKKLA